MVAYFLSVISFLTLYNKFAGYLALVSSLILIYLCTTKLISYGFTYLLPFLGIILIGILAHQVNEWKNLTKGK
jgi:hypothetical protein